MSAPIRIPLDSSALPLSVGLVATQGAQRVLLVAAVTVAVLAFVATLLELRAVRADVAELRALVLKVTP